MQYDFTVCGVATSVKVLKVREMPHIGITACILNTDYNVPTFGGPAWNISSALAKLNCRVLPVMTYTDCHFGPTLQKWLEDNHVPGFGIKPPPEGYSGAAIMIQDENKDHMTLGCQYGMTGPGIPAFVQKYDDAMFRDSSMIIFSAPRPENSAAMLEAILRSGKPYAFSMRHDPYAFPPERLQKIISSADIIFANEEETEYILSLHGCSNVQDLFDKGKMSLFISTMGKNGSRVYQRQKNDTIRLYKVDITETNVRDIDTVGAGDAYVSGFMYGLQRHCDVETCAQYGSTMSSFVIEKEGSTTNLPTEEQLLERNARRADNRIKL